MTASRQTRRLGDFIDTLKGFAFKSKWYSEAGTPIVKVSNFTTDSVTCDELVCIPEGIAEKYRRYALKHGDVVVQTVGSWPNNPASVVGKAVRIPLKARGALLNQNAVKLIPSEDLHQRFFFYLLRSSFFKNYIVGTAQGAASQASITLASIREFRFSLPEPTAQRRIASILSSYDDLIENNHSRIRILEEMAQNLY
ncbi:MAG: restriction endonuclease subunit S, partial [archaeon]|nr:restriction endonuclease subunit S [archaeon]